MIFIIVITNLANILYKYEFNQRLDKKVVWFDFFFFLLNIPKQNIKALLEQMNTYTTYKLQRLKLVML